MDEKQHPNNANKNSDAPNKTPGRPANANASANAKRIMSKRWLYPAIYLGAAAVIIGLMYARSQMASSPTSVQPTTDNTSTSTPTVSEPKGTFDWPVAQGVNPQVAVPFFPVKGTVTQQKAALVNYDNTYYPHKGISVKTNDGSSFQVTAAIGGTVQTVDNQPLYGQRVVIESKDGYTETYESLGSTNVKAGDTVKQGQTLGTTSTNVFEQSQGNHLYFEVDYNGQPIDPQSVLPKL